jgi:hypothetical protein
MTLHAWRNYSLGNPVSANIEIPNGEQCRENVLLMDAHCEGGSESGELG